MPFKNPFSNPKVKRTAIFIGIAVAIFFAVLLVIISPLAKYLIQKYDEKMLGRNIELSWVYVNPFTGYVYLKNVRIYEQNSDSLFFKADGISADLSMFKLLKKTYEISSVTVYRPWGHIILKADKRINFKDIIDHFRPKEGTIVVNKKRVKFSILDCNLKDGVFKYDDVITPVTYYIKHFNVYSPGKWWDKDTMLFNVTLESGPAKGTIKGNLTINFKTQDYRFGAEIDTFDLSPVSQYMRVLSNYGDFGGILTTRLDGSGNFQQKFFRSSGLISINQFQFGPSIYEDYGSFQRLVLKIVDADPERKKYVIDSIMLDRPYFRYEKYDSLDNLTMMFGKKGSKRGGSNEQFNLILKIAEYLQELIKNFAKSDYTINKFTLYKGNVIFTDFSPYEKFTVDAMPVHIHADSIAKNNARIKLFSKIEVRPYGDMHINVSLDPKDFGNFDIDYSIHKVPVSLFNPYLITYTSFPLNRGTLQLSGNWHVADSIITSTNHLLIIDPRVGKKMKRHDTKWIPLPLIMSLAREAGDVIDYEIPVKGNLKKPEFGFSNVIWDIVRNIFVKPPMTPYLMRVKHLENTVEKMLTLDWDARQATLSPIEDKFARTIAKFLQRNPENSIKVLPLMYAEKEKEHIAFFEAKKKYFLTTGGRGRKMSEDDSLDMEEFSVKNPSFIRWLDKLAGDSMMFSTLQKCRFAVGDPLIDTRLTQLTDRRKQAFLAGFAETGTAAQVKFTAPQMGVPFNGFSRYTIDYNGNIPEQLQKAYEELEQTNKQAPRKKYKAKRWLPRVKGMARKE